MAIRHPLTLSCLSCVTKRDREEWMMIAVPLDLSEEMFVKVHRLRSEFKEGVVRISCKQSMSVPCCWCRSMMASRLSMFFAVL